MNSPNTKTPLYCGFVIALLAIAFAINFTFKREPTNEGEISKRERFDDGRPTTTSSNENRAPSGRTTSPHGRKKTVNTQADDAPATINEHGFITSSVVERAGLSEEEKGLVQSLFTEHRSNMQKLIQKNMSTDQSKSDPNLGLRAFVIKPFAAEGRAEYDRLISNLDSTVGNPRRNVILQGYPDTEFFYYGRNEALIRLYCGDAAGNLLAPGDDKTTVKTMTRAEVIIYDPNSGKTLGKSSCSLKSLTEAVGAIFPDSED